MKTFYPQQQEDDTVTGALSAMQEKGVKEDLLKELNLDQGFHRFCTEQGEEKSEDRRSMPNDAGAIISLKNEIKDLKSLVKKLGVFRSRLIEQSVNPDIIKLETKFFTDKINMLFRTKYPLSPENRLSFDLKNVQTIKLLKILQKNILPNYRSVSLISIVRNPKIVKLFLSKSFPSKVQKLRLINIFDNINDKKMIKIGKYFKELRHVLPRVTQIVLFFGLEINQGQLKKIFYLWKDKRKVEFGEWTILLNSEFDLTKALTKSKIEELIFDDHENSAINTWFKNSQSFGYLIHALYQSDDFLLNLKKLSIWVTEIPNADLWIIFRKYPVIKPLIHPITYFPIS